MSCHWSHGLSPCQSHCLPRPCIPPWDSHQHLSPFPFAKSRWFEERSSWTLHVAIRTIHQLWVSQSSICTGAGALSFAWPPTGTFLKTSTCPGSLVVADMAAGTSWPQHTTFPKYYVFQGVGFSCYIWQVSFIAFSSNGLVIGGKIWGHLWIIPASLLCLLHTHATPLLPRPEEGLGGKGWYSEKCISVFFSLQNISRIRLSLCGLVCFDNIHQHLGRMRCGVDQDLQISLMEDMYGVLSFLKLQAGISKLPLRCQKGSYRLIGA